MDIITLWRTRFSNRSLLVDFAPTDEKPIVYSTLFNEWLKFIDSGVSGSSITNVKDSIAFFTKNEDFIGQLIANDILAQVYDQLGIYKEALTHIHNALSLDNIDNNLPELGDLYATAGNIQLRLEDFDGAFKHYETSLAIRDHNNDSYAKASVLNLMSRLKAEQGDYKGSEEFYKKTIELRISLNDSALPWSYFGLSNVYYLQNNFKQCLETLRLDDCSSYCSKNIRFRIISEILIGKCLIELSNYDEALNLLLKLENDTTNFDSKPLKYQMFEQISIAYDQLKDVSAAFSYYKLFVSSKNEVINEENNRQIRNQEINFTINKVEQEKEIERLKNVELKNALDEIREKNNELLSSLTYAKRLQEAILPPPRIVKEWLTESFLFYRPKDIVSGDFYWMETVDTILDGVKKTLIFFAAADCTGHGVPGAMVSVVCANALNRSVKEFQLKTPGGVLNKVTELVLEAFEQSDEVIKDGMDIALCALDISANKLFYSGANNPLYRITKTAANSENKYISADGSYELLQYNACRSPIGKQESKHVFVTQEIQLNSGDAIYMFSDGFPDQFGGQKGKKYKYANFKRFLLEHYALPMEQQKSHLEDEFDNWKQSFEQIDDVCIIGVKINDQEKDNLTPRELEILTLIAQGLPSKIIADKLYISKHTVDTHRRRLLAKTGTVNSSDLVNYARKKDII